MTGQTSWMSRQERPTRSERVSAPLEHQILSGELPSGAKLPSERTLAQTFGISRTAVREAIRSLVERNLVEVVAGAGAYVSEANSAVAALPLDITLRRQHRTPRQIIEARKMFEIEAARLGALRADEIDLAVMERALEQFDDSASIVDQARCDIIFHLSVVRAAKNPVIETIFHSITSLTFELMLRSLGDQSVSRVGVPFHTEVFEAIREKDPEAASHAMAGHLSVAEAFYGPDMDRSLKYKGPSELMRAFDPMAQLDDLAQQQGGKDGTR